MLDGWTSGWVDGCMYDGTKGTCLMDEYVFAFGVVA